MLVVSVQGGIETNTERVRSGCEDTATAEGGRDLSAGYVLARIHRRRQERRLWVRRRFVHTLGGLITIPGTDSGVPASASLTLS
jgi:hypothetical protein